MRGSLASTAPEPLGSALKAEARALGFDAVGITAPDAIPEAEARLNAFLKEGFAGDMAWLARDPARRARPRVLWSDVNSIVLVGLNYGPATEPRALQAEPAVGAISVYARNADYHDVLKKKLKALARWLLARAGGDVKVFVDTAAVMEKPLAEAAGLGWQGKHTNLVSRTRGSWLFLGALFTTATLAPDAPETDHCGGCRACLDACPTHAFPAPYRLDARRCISYLTIEHKGHIPDEFRAAIGNRIYGCDDCLAVCPWNKFAVEAHEMTLRPRPALTAPALSGLAALDDAAFRALFAGSPIKRIGRDRFVRNVAIALGNAGAAADQDAILRLLSDGSPLVRAAAVWALKQATGADVFAAERERRVANEVDDAVRAAWDGPDKQKGGIDARPSNNL